MRKLVNRRLIDYTALALGMAFSTAGPVSAQDWKGAYAAGGLSFGSFEINDLSFGDGPVSLDGAGFVGFVGYNFQSGNLVFGPELMLAIDGGDGDDGEFLRPAEIEHSVGLRARIGYASGKFLPYLAVGAARTRFEADHEGDGDEGDIFSENANGVSVALGLDYAMSERSFLRVEIERIEYDDDSIVFYGDDPHDYELTGDRISIAYGVRF